MENAVNALLENQIVYAEHSAFTEIVRQESILRQFFWDHFGYPLTVRRGYFAKVTKIPGSIQPWMGVSEFRSADDYGLYFLILAFLDDKERYYSFSLTILCEFIEQHVEGRQAYWKPLPKRQAMVRSLKHALKHGILRERNGETDGFAEHGIDNDFNVLYESTASAHVFFSQTRPIPISVTLSPTELIRTTSMHQMMRRLLLEPGRSGDPSSPKRPVANPFRNGNFPRSIAFVLSQKDGERNNHVSVTAEIRT